MNITKIREEAEYLRSALSDIHEGAADRALTADEQARYDEGKAALAERRELIERHNEVLRLAEIPEAVVSGDGARFEAPSVIVRNDPFDLSDLRFDATPGEVRSRALSAIEKVEGLADGHREQAERITRSLNPSVALRLVATGTDAYRTAFQKRLADPMGRTLTPEEHAAESRAASLTGNAGGYAVPFTLDPTIILTSDGSANPFRQISRVVPIDTDQWNGVSSAGVTAAFAAEAAEVADGAPTLAQPSINVHKAHAFVPFSIEIGQDWVGLERDIMALFVDAKDTLEATKFAVGAGDGSNEPVGIVTALAGTGSEINSAASEAFSLPDLYALEEALGPRFRPNASWVANKAWYNKVRQFDTAGGASLWERLGAGMPPQLLGYNAYEASAMDSSINAAATANNYVMVLGDFQNYVIADRVGMSVELVPHLFATANNLPSGQRGFYAFWRVGADSVNDAAFSLLDIPTTA